MPNNYTYEYHDLVSFLPRHPTKTYDKRNLSKIDSIVVHCTDANWTVERLAQYDIAPNHISNTGCPAITYHDVIMSDGTLNHTLDYKEISWHAGGYNTGSIAVALMYKVTDEAGRDMAPTFELVDSLTQYLTQRCFEFGLTPDVIQGHRELKGTGWFFVRGHKRLRKTCPGMKVDLDKLRADVAYLMQIELRDAGLYLGKADGIFGTESKKALKEYMSKK